MPVQRSKAYKNGHSGFLLCFIVLCVPFLLSAASVPPASGSGRPKDFKDAGWWTHENRQQRYSLNLPAWLKVSFTKTNPLEWSADNRMPFDYVNFRPQPEHALAAPFELGVGVHWNRDRLSTRDFADKKDDGLRSGGAQIKIIRQSEITVFGIAGVRDDFRLRQPDGWRSYSRVIIPREDKFIVFLGTLGADAPDAGHERVYQKIIGSLTLR